MTTGGTVARGHPGGTLLIGGSLPVTRLGLGAMRMTGPGAWGPPPDRDAAVALLRQAAGLGIGLVDTADSYGPYVSEELIARALHPYDGITVATKGGLVRPGPGEWHPVGHPAYLRQCVEMSLRRLRVDRIGLYYLHRIDSLVPLADQVGVLDDLRAEGKIGHLGLSEVTVPQLAEARLIARIAAVQNRYHVLSRGADDLLAYCEREQLAFVPWSPVGTGSLARPGSPLEAVARQAGATPAQIALAWLLHRSPAMVAIPGTASPAHLAENVAAAGLDLDDGICQALCALGTG